MTEFSVNDQRSTDALEVTEIYAAREIVPDEALRERARTLVGAEPWGREQWEKLGEGLLFEGMESWLPWLTDSELLLTDLLGDDTLVVLVEPRRMRDRATDLLAEEDDLAKSLSATWNREQDDTFRGCTPIRAGCSAPAT
ncbi:MAG: hypothetical protein R2705_00460 [Ilumatobacteraceae bacterium]